MKRGGACADTEPPWQQANDRESGGASDDDSLSVGVAALFTYVSHKKHLHHIHLADPVHKQSFSGANARSANTNFSDSADVVELVGAGAAVA